MFKLLARNRTVAMTALVAVLVLIPMAVWASHRFVDVPNSHTFHNAIDWMDQNGITVGCNPPANDRYCPDDFVTRGQMAAFMKRLAENDVVESAGTAYEAVRDPSVTLTGETPGTANSIATLTGLEPGAYMATATWTGVASGEDGGGRVVCNLSVGSASARAQGIVSATAPGSSSEDSMAAVVVGSVGAGDVVNLSCWREGGGGELSVVRTNLVAYPVGAMQTINVNS